MIKKATSPNAGRIFLLLVVMLAGRGATSACDVDSCLAKREIMLADEPFRVEVATTDAEKSRGLMHQESLADGQGMLFLFQPAAAVRFWMKDVTFALDILFFDEKGCLLDHHDRAPPCATPDCAFYATEHPTTWVLEVPADTRERLRIPNGACVLSLGHEVHPTGAHSVEPVATPPRD